MLIACTGRRRISDGSAQAPFPSLATHLFSATKETAAVREHRKCADFSFLGVTHGDTAELRNRPQESWVLRFLLVLGDFDYSARENFRGRRNLLSKKPRGKKGPKDVTLVQAHDRPEPKRKIERKVKFLGHLPDFHPVCLTFFSLSGVYSRRSLKNR